MWVREFEGGILWAVARVDFAVELRWAGTRIELEAVATRAEREEEVDVVNALDFGVLLFSAEEDGSRLFRGGAGALSPPILGKGTEVSDIGGDGGSCISDAVSAVDNDLVSGGVMIIGELAVECGELQKEGEPGTEMSVEMVDKWRDSCFLILSCRISASILRSASSSLSLCVSTRSRSRSCSPILTSSSSMTALSIATLYLDSRSSRDDVVVRA
jgi:hypothetical protein